MLSRPVTQISARTAHHFILAAATALTSLAGQADLCSASPPKLTPLHTFCSSSSTCADGASPKAGVIADASGNLYGTTYNGGVHTWGTAFELTPAARKKWKETVLYDFCAKGGSGCSDGQAPAAALIMDESGNLYGTTQAGGTHASGVVFELLSGVAGKKRTEKVLYDFCARKNCVDGNSPAGSVMMDESGNLYGATSYGGAYHSGAVFELTLDSATQKWTEKAIYSFCPQVGCPDGAGPSGGVIMDKAGNLYGVAGGGGTTCNPGCGVVFELTPNLVTKRWKERVLYSFLPADGTSPAGGVIMDKAGDLYGVTQSGGTGCQPNVSCGAVFELSLDAATKKWTINVLHHFCTQSGCADGDDPVSGVIMDKAGNLYGTTPYGGSYTQSVCATYNTGCGVVFELVPDAAKKTWRETVLHTFCQTDCADGAGALAGVTLPCSSVNGVYACEGTLFGTTNGGGDLSYCYGQGCGLVYEQEP